MIVVVLLIDDGNDDASMLLSLLFVIKFPNGSNKGVSNEWNVGKRNV